MTLFSTRLVAIGFAMLVAAGLALVAEPRAIERADHPDLDAMIPRQFRDWRIDPDIIPVAPSPDKQKALDEVYDQLVNRTYVNAKGERIMLSIAYGSQQTHQLKAHRQEVCYAAQGFSVRDVVHQTITLRDRTIPVTRLYAINGRRHEPVTYWFTMGNRVVLSRAERFLVQIKYGVTGQIPDGILVRVSNISTDRAKAYAAHVEFLDALLSTAGEDAALRLMGAAA